MADGTDAARTMKRRGILAAAAAVMAGIVTKQTSRPVTAGIDGDVVLGSVSNATTTETGVLNSGPASPGGPAIHGFRSPGAITVVATTFNAGLVGQTFVTNAPGVMGSSPNGSQAKGVYGISGGGSGVYGESTSGTGVVGTSVTGSGVVGGTSSATPGTAGGYFYNTANNSSGVVGQVFAASGAVAFVGAAVPPNYAAYFTGPVVVEGQLVVSDPSYKSGALLHPDGTHRLVYCVESPESWIEDVGTGTLSSGKATVTFDPDFAAVTHTDTYHVFLTEYAETQGLFVSNRGASGFTVQERNKGTTSGTFSWKVMVKGKSGVKQERLGNFVMPTIKLASAPPPTPKPPEPRKKP